jgi:hypothetical protein
MRSRDQLNNSLKNLFPGFSQNSLVADSGGRAGTIRATQATRPAKIIPMAHRPGRFQSRCFAATAG